MAKQSKSKVELYDEKKRQSAQMRLNELHAKDWLAVSGDIYADLSGAEMKDLHLNCESFKNAEARLETIKGFRGLTSEQQEEFFAGCNEATRALLEKDGYVASQTNTLARSPGEHEDESQDRRAEEQNRIFTESADAVETQNEKLYAGVEIKEGRYFLTIDPEDGTQPEVFKSRPIAEGGHQGEVWKLLRDSKKNATRELRRRANAVKLTKELRELEVEIVNYPALETKVSLSAAELFDATEMLKNPSTAVEGARLLRLASITQEEVDRNNAILIRSFEQEAQTIASTWITNNPQFYLDPENKNIGALREIMGGLNWAVTLKNLSTAYSALVEQGALIEKLPETEPEFRTGPAPKERPAPFIPPSASTAPRVPAAPAVRPAPRKILNNTSAGGGETSFVRRNTTPAKPTAMTSSEYHSISAVELKTRYHRDEAFKARVDAYWAEGGR